MPLLKFSWLRHLMKVLLLTLAAVVIYNEWLALRLASQSWESMAIGEAKLASADATHPKSVPVRVLLVADPQMLSTLSEPYYPLSLFAVWDANNFMKKGFEAAIRTAKPDVVIFLGDLLNDGSIASDAAFEVMKNDFLNAFAVPDSVKLSIYLPGDNDVGGEGKDLLTDAKIERFLRAFPLPSDLRYLFLQAVPVSNELDGHISTQAAVQQPGVISILLSHVPLLPGTTHRKKLLAEKPSLIFSGHFHESFHFLGEKSKGHASSFWAFTEPNTVLNFSLFSKEMHEILVPTCNYRMGKKSYGFGLAVIDSKGWLEYGVYWLPSRFWQLQLYCGLLGVMVLLLLLPHVPRLFYTVYCYTRRVCGSQVQENQARLSQAKKGYVKLVSFH
ncbi:Calcineurin-like phosphoesterase domain ApaH type [Trinorchestia longiramus]|nr:Calcineurin-like phosphoesterase domain ApaH type [Trinorchestia longiramus]